MCLGLMGHTVTQPSSGEDNAEDPRGAQAAPRAVSQPDGHPRHRVRRRNRADASTESESVTVHVVAKASLIGGGS
jgi:hypothetical protein